jgi:hypothetical protein
MERSHPGRKEAALRRLIGRRGVGSALGESEWSEVRVGRRPALLCPHEATPPLFNPTPTSSAAAPRAPDWREHKSALLHPTAHHAPRLHFFQHTIIICLGDGANI